MGLTCVHVEATGTFALVFDRERSSSHALNEVIGFCGEKHISDNRCPPSVTPLNIINTAEA